MPRIKARLSTQDETPCGRLVPIGDDFDSGEKIAEFTVPSGSRSNRVYICFVDFISAECDCACEGMKDYREASKMPYNRDKGGSYVEHLALSKNYYILPLITRPRRFLCRHLKRVQDWLYRHGMMGHMRFLEQQLTARAEAAKPKKRVA